MNLFYTECICTILKTSKLNTKWFKQVVSFASLIPKSLDKNIEDILKILISGEEGSVISILKYNINLTVEFLNFTSI